MYKMGFCTFSNYISRFFIDCETYYTCSMTNPAEVKGLATKKHPQQFLLDSQLTPTFQRLEQNDLQRLEHILATLSKNTYKLLGLDL